jgi:hypothetical protein
MVAAAALCAGLGGGCTGTRAIEEGEVYPQQIAQGSTLDVQVFRSETTISFTNTTPAALPAGRMWLNGWYSDAFAGLAPGASVTLDLRNFKDRYGDTFRAGGFFATELPEKLVLVQIHSGEQVVGLKVVSDGAEGY